MGRLPPIWRLKKPVITIAAVRLLDDFMRVGIWLADTENRRTWLEQHALTNDIASFLYTRPSCDKPLQTAPLSKLNRLLNPLASSYSLIVRLRLVLNHWTTSLLSIPLKVVAQPLLQQEFPIFSYLDFRKIRCW